MTRILIAGGPRTGKTTLATRLLFTHVGASNDRGVLDRRLRHTERHTDDLINLGWSEASATVAAWMNDPGPWVIEGVAVPRALRKWLERNEGKPCDVVYWLEDPHEELTPGQAAMAKGCATVWDEIEAELRDRGVEVRIGR